MTQALIGWSDPCKGESAAGRSHEKAGAEAPAFLVLHCQYRCLLATRFCDDTGYDVGALGGFQLAQGDEAGLEDDVLRQADIV